MITKVGTNEVHTNGDMPAVGKIAPDFTLADNKLSDITLNSFRGHSVVLNIFPQYRYKHLCSISTRIQSSCSQSREDRCALYFERPAIRHEAFLRCRRHRSRYDTI